MCVRFSRGYVELSSACNLDKEKLNDAKESDSLPQECLLHEDNDGGLLANLTDCSKIHQIV